MNIQHILFPSTSTCTDEAMYFRRNENVEYSWADDCIKLNNDAFVGFDTYFNSITAEKWYKYCNINAMYITIKAKGTFKFTVYRKEKGINKVVTEYISETILSSEDISEYTMPLNSTSTNGIYGFSISTSDNDEAEFYGGYYSADIPTEKIRPVKIAIDICTYRRERFVQANLELLSKRFLNNDDSELNNALEIFVSDNAKTLDTDKLQSDKIHIYKNKNAGGAGGFTRGLIEINRVKKERGITHALVMDDDIRIEPESIFRTFAILSCLKDTYADAFIGGAMLRLDNKNIQTESGARWDAGNLISFKRGLNLSNLDSVLFNEQEESPQFNAWWYCAFPTDVITDTNLPMPIFIRGDDVEYGLRNMKHLILMNGICVWHEPFENKYSSFLYYYILRNRLIDNSLHNMAMSKADVKELIRRSVTEQLWIYRYKNADLLMDGVEDFLKGVDWLSSQDGEKLHQSVMAKGYKLQYPEDTDEHRPFLNGMLEQSLMVTFKADVKTRLIRRLTINGHCLSVQKDYVIVPTEGAHAGQFYRVNTAMNYDYSSRKCFITKRDPKRAKECTNRFKQLCKLIDAKYDTAVNDYKNNFRKLTSIDFWSKYLEL